MRREPIDLAALEEDLEPVKLPNGRILEVRPFGPEEYALWREIQATGDDALSGQLLRRCIPNATDEDVACLTPKMAAVIVGLARRQLQLVLEVLEKNARGALAAPTSPPSTQPTTRDMSSPASSDGSAAGPTASGASGASPTGARSGSSPRSRKRNGSSSSSVSPTTSPRPSA